MRAATLLCSAVLASFCYGQTEDRPAPSFTVASVLPAGADRPVPLAPGRLASIYGEHLGPAAACEGPADPALREVPRSERPTLFLADTLIYPKTLCDTQVLVSGVPAGLLYVQDRQINFKVPLQTSVNVDVEIRVVYLGLSSPPVKVAVKELFLETPAKVGQPVWLRVSMAGADETIRYPFDIHPAVFWCHEIEVRRNGILLAPAATIDTQAFDGIVFAGNICGGLGLPAESRRTARIPLHLRYRFNWPGVYEVRYSWRNSFPDQPSVPQTDWTEIDILPGTPAERQRWLKERNRHAPTGTTELLTDFLPDILGIPDPQSLAILRRYLYHSDILVRQYAMYGLTYWPPGEAGAAVRQALRVRGPSDVAVRFLTRPQHLPTDDADVVQLALPYLRSDDMVLLRGAVAAVRSMDSADPQIRARAESALIQASDHIAATADSQTVNDCAAALGGFKDDQTASVLWSWIGRNIARDQATAALTWRRSPDDLPKLAELAMAPSKDDTLELSNLPNAMRAAYGDAANPYLEKMMESSGSTRVRTASARELVLAGRPSGFAFIAATIEKNQPYRGEMIQFLRGQFPELRQAGDAEVLAFAKARTGSR